MLRSERPSGTCAELHTVAASSNGDHPTRSLSSAPVASTINCSPGSQALSEVFHRDHSIAVTWGGDHVEVFCHFSRGRESFW